MFLSDRVGARVIYLWIRMQAATVRVYTSGTQNSEKKTVLIPEPHDYLT